MNKNKQDMEQYKQSKQQLDGLRVDYNLIKEVGLIEI